MALSFIADDWYIAYRIHKAYYVNLHTSVWALAEIEQCLNNFTSKYILVCKGLKISVRVFLKCPARKGYICNVCTAAESDASYN